MEENFSIENESTEKTEEELQDEQIEKAMIEDNIFKIVPDKTCENCVLSPCNLRAYLNASISKTNIYNGAVGTKFEIAKYDDSWTCGNHVLTK